MKKRLQNYEIEILLALVFILVMGMIIGLLKESLL